jgi:hypothetical protein
MLAFRDLHNGTVFVEADQPPSVVHMSSPGTIGTTLDESDLRRLLRVVEGAEPEKLTATRDHLAGEA